MFFVSACGFVLLPSLFFFLLRSNKSWTGFFPSEYRLSPPPLLVLFDWTPLMDGEDFICLGEKVSRFPLPAQYLERKGEGITYTMKYSSSLHAACRAGRRCSPGKQWKSINNRWWENFTFKKKKENARPTLDGQKWEVKTKTPRDRWSETGSIYVLYQSGGKTKSV